MIATEGANSRFCPGIVPTSALTGSIENVGDVHIGHQSSEFPDNIAGRRVQPPAMFTGPCLDDLKVGVIAALPVQYQINLVAGDRSDNFDQNGAQNALARLYTGGWVVPGLFKVCTERQEPRTFLFVDRWPSLRCELCKSGLQFLNNIQTLVPAALQLRGDVPMFRFHGVILPLRPVGLVASLLQRRRHAERLQQPHTCWLTAWSTRSAPKEMHCSALCVTYAARQKYRMFPLPL
jgi:hypothetical protein